MKYNKFEIIAFTQIGNLADNNRSNIHEAVTAKLLLTQCVSRRVREEKANSTSIAFFSEQCLNLIETLIEEAASSSNNAYDCVRSYQKIISAAASEISVRKAAEAQHKHTYQPETANGTPTLYEATKPQPEAARGLTPQCPYPAPVKKVVVGYDLDTKAFIFRDCAVLESGEIKFPDDQGWVYIDGYGFRLEHETFCQMPTGCAPSLFPQQISLPARETQLNEITENHSAEKTFVAKLLGDFINNLAASYSKTTAHLLTFSTLAWIIAPQTIAKYNSQHGLWLRGGMGDGKTDTARFLMNLMGYPLNYDTPSFRGSTYTAIDRCLSLYCAYPIHLDEFYEDGNSNGKMVSLRNAHSRGSRSKGRLNPSQPVESNDPLTTPIITGESSTTDAATKSRFVNLLLQLDRKGKSSAELKWNYEKLLASAPMMHRVIRWIMMNRHAFTTLCEHHTMQWMNCERVQQAAPSPRIRITYASSYAVGCTLNEILYQGMSTSPNALKNQILQHIIESNTPSK